MRLEKRQAFEGTGFAGASSSKVYGHRSDVCWRCLSHAHSKAICSFCNMTPLEKATWWLFGPDVVGYFTSQALSWWMAMTQPVIFGR